MSGEISSRKIILNLQRESREVVLDVLDSNTFIEVLRSAKIAVDGVLVFSNGVPIPLDSEVEGHKKITIINVASGG